MKDIFEKQYLRNASKMAFDLFEKLICLKRKDNSSLKRDALWKAETDQAL